MKKVLIDTNVVIDLLAQREPFYKNTSRLFTLASKKLITAYVSSLTLVTTHFIVSRELSETETRKVIRRFKSIANALDLKDAYLNMALDSDFKDFEDAIQYHTALSNNLDAIITRNKRDFKKSHIPVYTTEEYLELYFKK
ncbi:MAG: type II toxin-antitoxin system VapC family toxin [Ignavibacteria bacterium]|jgi:predicted nucleic acid-binding protein